MTKSSEEIKKCLDILKWFEEERGSIFVENCSKENLLAPEDVSILFKTPPVSRHERYNAVEYVVKDKIILDIYTYLQKKGYLPKTELKKKGRELIESYCDYIQSSVEVGVLEEDFNKNRDLEKLIFNSLTQIEISKIVDKEPIHIDSLRFLIYVCRAVQSDFKLIINPEEVLSDCEYIIYNYYLIEGGKLKKDKPEQRLLFNIKVGGAIGQIQKLAEEENILFYHFK